MRVYLFLLLFVLPLIVSADQTAILVQSANAKLPSTKKCNCADEERIPNDNFMIQFPEQPKMIADTGRYGGRLSKAPDYPPAIGSTSALNQAAKHLEDSATEYAHTFKSTPLSDENLAAITSFFIANWCTKGVIHSICGNGSGQKSKIFQLEKFKLYDKPRPTFDPKEGATGLMLLTAEGQYLRLYFNANKGTSKENGLYYADGNTGVIYKNGHGMNSIENLDVFVKKESTELSVSWGPNPHLGKWEHNAIKGSERTLTISQPKDQFEEVWSETSYSQLSSIQKTALGPESPGFKSLAKIPK